MCDGLVIRVSVKETTVGNELVIRVSVKETKETVKEHRW